MVKRYFWQEWFGRAPDADGKVRFVLVRGQHYDCSQSSIIMQLRIAATHCGYRVCATDMDDRIGVAAVRRDAAQQAAAKAAPVTDSSVTVEVPFVRMTNVDVPAV